MEKEKEFQEKERDIEKEKLSAVHSFRPDVAPSYFVSFNWITLNDSFSPPLCPLPFVSLRFIIWLISSHRWFQLIPGARIADG